MSCFPLILTVVFSLRLLDVNSIDTVDSLNRSTVMYAVHYSQIGALHHLLEAGANVDHLADGMHTLKSYNSTGLYVLMYN